MDEKMRALLSQKLAEYPEIVFAVLYGSAVDGEKYRDIDIAIFVDQRAIPKGDDWKFAFSVAEALENIAPFPVDVRVINNAPLPFRYNVSKGLLLHQGDSMAWADFKEWTWIEYLDFQPVAMRYLKEMK